VYECVCVCVCVCVSVYVFTDILGDEFLRAKSLTENVTNVSRGFACVMTRAPIPSQKSRIFH